MNQFFKKVGIFLLEIFFPIRCINCQRENFYLCPDCFSLIELNNQHYCPFCRPAKIVLDGKTCSSCRQKGKKLTGLFFAAPYQNFILKKIISQYKYEPFVKDLSKTLSLLIIQHFQTIDNKPSFFKDKRDFVFVPVPLSQKRKKWRGFNQAEEIAKELSLYYNIPLANNVLLKIKDNFSQTDLSGKEREENVRGIFKCISSEAIKNKKILLVDDVFTTGSTMEECALTLKQAGAKEVWGIAVARE